MKVLKLDVSTKPLFTSLVTYFSFQVFHINYSTGNEQLARSGSNCLENLIVSTGKQFFPDMWDRVCDCISDIFTASLPTELLTWKPPERLYRTQSNASLGSSISESPLPPTGRPISVASVESSAVEPQAPPDEEKEATTTETSAAPEITVIPSSPPMSKETEDKQTTGEVNNTTSTNTPINAQDDTKNSTQGHSKNSAPDDTTVNVPSDTLMGDSHQSHDHVQRWVQDTVTEEKIENSPLLNEETDHPVSHDTPQHHVPASSGRPPVVNKQAQQKEKRQGSFLQRKKRGSTGSGTGKKKSNAITSVKETSNRKDSLAKKHHKLSHLQSPDADLAKSKFNKMGMM